MNIDDPISPIGAVEPTAIDFQSPGRFAIDNPNPQSQQNHTSEWQPAPYKLGATRAIQRFASPDDARRHALALLEQAQRSLCLYSPDFEPWLYNHSSIQQACTRFVLAHPRNRLRILLGDSSRAVKQGHRLLSLARRLTSSIQIRTLQPDYPSEVCAFLVVDDCGVLVRPEPDQFAGYALYQDPSRALQRQRLFDRAWDHSLPDPDLRSFLL